MQYEVTDTNVEMDDTFGNALGIHPVYVFEAEDGEEALSIWESMPWHDRDTEGVTAKLVES